MWDSNQLIDKRITERLNSIKWGYFGLLSILVFLLYGFTSTTFHVSYTEIIYHQANTSISFEVEVITTDLEQAILLEYKPNPFNIESDSISPQSEQYIQNYITDKTTVIIDGIILKQPTFQSSISKKDRTIIRYTYSDLPTFKSFSFYSELFISRFPDQQNIVEFNHNNLKNKALLTKSKLNNTWLIEQ